MLWSVRGSTAGGADDELAFGGGFRHHLGHIPFPFMASVADVQRGTVRREDESVGGSE
jgi:hypothetical protein